ncbi:hypothetical protein JCM15519_17680 [Fundidesulfovibrio butyratiphilus]
MTLRLIRHLPTAFTLERRLMGRRDEPLAPLTEEARQGIARNLALLARGDRIEAVYTSTLKRTRQTARAYGFAAHEPTPLLDELDFGQYEGLSKDQFEIATGGLWKTAPHRLTLGEPLDALCQRVEAFLCLVSKRKGPVLAFCHGAWMRAAIALVRHGDARLMNHMDSPHNALTYLQIPTRPTQHEDQA